MTRTDKGTPILILLVVALLAFLLAGPARGERATSPLVDRVAGTPILSDPGSFQQFPDNPNWEAESDQANCAYGSSVATVGDVNGDGYSDVAVGAYSYDDPEDGEGKLFLYIGGQDGISSTVSWTAEIDQPGARFGFSVACAGDVNGDGYDDVIVGAPNYDVSVGRGDELTDAGAAFVYYGGGSGPPPGPIVLEGDQEFARFASSVATAGDVNGDGYDDVIIGAIEYGNGQAEEGRAFVYHGSASGIATSPAWWAESDEGGAHFGHSVCTAGDVNGDGYADVVIGARNFTDTASSQGKVYVYLGSDTGLAGTPSWTALGENSGDNFGFSVSTAGDLNADGYSDIIVGAPYHEIIGTDTGMAYIYFGDPSGQMTDERTYFIPDDYAYTGYSVATAGDTNGDGFSDVIIGAPRAWAPVRAGEIIVIQGKASGLDTDFIWREGFWQDEAWFGACVATAGDVNGDGYSDILIGATAYDNGQTSEGLAVAYYGAADEVSYLPAVVIDNGGFGAVGSEADGEPGVDWTFDKDASGRGVSYFGSVAYAGDVNGDGFSDVIVGESTYSNGQSSEGRALVYLGGAEGLQTTPVWEYESNNLDAVFGESVGTAGDVNGDGFSDVIVGSPGFTNGQLQEGKVFVFFGSPAGPSPTPDWTAEGNQENAAFGWSVATAGDHNGDGYADIIIGSPSYSNGQDYEGRAYVYLGGELGIESTPLWDVESDEAWAQLGYSVASAGDVNGDGLSDVIIGVPVLDSKIDDVGAAFVYLGPGGPDPMPVWGTYELQMFSGYGTFVASAGDVNGDGYSDIAVGAPYRDENYTNEGRIYVFHGASYGVEPDPWWWFDGQQDYAVLGPCGTAGDINGDGYSDLIVGEPGYDAGEENEGIAHVVKGSDNGLFEFSWVGEGNEDYAVYGTRVSTAGDINGDGCDDIAVLSPGHNAGVGATFYYLGNVQWDAHAANALRPQQRRTTGAPVDLLGNSYSTAFRLNVRGRTPAGRARVRLQWGVERLGVPFDHEVHEQGPWFETGPVIPGEGSAVILDELVAGLEDDKPYRWRVRVKSSSPFFPHSPWMSMPTTVSTLTQLRTGTGASHTPETGASRGLLIEAVRPNPFAPRTSVILRLPETGHARVEIVTVDGRRIRTLVDGDLQAGRHVLDWDGRDQEGRPVSAGTYMTRVVSAEGVESVRLVRVK